VVVRIHLAEGNLAEAVRAHDAFRDMLADELGVAPMPQMEVLLYAARIGRPARPAPAPFRFAAPARESRVSANP
jgi:DNA-binding SARP family transcriptional activator